MSASPYQRAPEVVYGRDVYIPEWAPRVGASDLGVPVRAGGQPLGFTIGDMLPERVWAVDVASGEVLPQLEFERLYRQYLRRTVVRGVIRDVAQHDRYHDFGVDPVPSVVEWVSRTLDYEGKEVRIGFDPHAAPTATEREVKVYTAQGEEWTPRQRENADLRSKLSVLMQLRAENVLTDEQFTAQAMKLQDTGDAEPASDSAPPEGFEAAPELDPLELTARCGRVCGSKAGKLAHERNCDVCSPKEAA